MTTTIGETRKLRPHQFLLDPYVTRAREIETIREAAKLTWRADASTDIRSHLWGALGELLVADTLGTQVDDAAKYSDGGVDGTFRDYTYDVKTSTFHHDPILKVFATAKHWPDFFILVSVDKDTLIGEIVGWAWEEDVKKAPLHNFGRGQSYTLRRHELRSVAELLAL